MQSFTAAGNSDLYCHPQSPFCFRDDEVVINNEARVADFKELEQSAVNGFHHQESVDLTRLKGSAYNGIKTSNISVLSHHLHFGGLTNNLVSTGMGCSSDTGQLIMLQKVTTMGYGGDCGGNFGDSHFGNWEHSNVVPDQSQRTDNSTDTDEKNQVVGDHQERPVTTVLADNSKARDEEQKTLRRLAQNREAARKSRMRKKAYVQQLEKSTMRLQQLEKDITRSKQQGITVPGFLRDFSICQNDSLAFDMNYARWLDEHHQLMNDLRSSLSSHVPELELQLIVDSVMSHYDSLFRIKSSGLKSDVFHILSGMWKTPVERCLMWLGGFRPSEILKVLGNQIEPLTEQQLVGICDLQQSSQQAEDALSQGMEALQQTFVHTLSSNVLNPHSNLVDYMNVMAIAMSKLVTIENFLHQADLLRFQTLLQLRRILTTPQAARGLLAIEDYKSRLQALSSLWLAHPKV